MNTARDTTRDAATHDNVVVFGELGFPQVCKACSARRFGLCGALMTHELARLAQHTRQRKVARGETIQFDTDETHEYVNIVSGVVKLTKLLADGRQQIVGLQYAPEFVGRPFSDSARVNAEAASDVELCVIPKSAIEAMLDESSDFQRRLLDQTLAQLDEAREWMLALGRKSASEKVASLLLSLLRHLGTPVVGRDGAVALDLALSRSEIADFLGLSIETVSRVLTKLRVAGVIEIVQTSRIIVPELDALTETAECDRDG